MLKPKIAHVWTLDAAEHYVEEPWVDRRLFEVEKFAGVVYDPCAGFGQIPQAARAAGYTAYAGDILDHGCAGGLGYLGNFLDSTLRHTCVVMNPPFTLAREFILHALAHTSHKVAAIVATRRLNAAGKWLSATPLYRIHYLTPRPSMPPGSYLLAGRKPRGGTVDFCWLVWLHGYDGEPVARWLHRDGGPEC
jgi:hypothetical protein